MSGASASTNPSTTKATVPSNTNQEPALPAQKPTTQLEEDDEFEDFPVEDWGDEDTEAAAATENFHLWEESWDDDDTREEFAEMLKEELEKLDAKNKS